VDQCQRDCAEKTGAGRGRLNVAAAPAPAIRRWCRRKNSICQRWRSDSGAALGECQRFGGNPTLEHCDIIACRGNRSADRANNRPDSRRQVGYFRICITRRRRPDFQNGERVSCRCRPACAKRHRRSKRCGRRELRGDCRRQCGNFRSAYSYRNGERGDPRRQYQQRITRRRCECRADQQRQPFGVRAFIAHSFGKCKHSPRRKSRAVGRRAASAESSLDSVIAVQASASASLSAAVRQAFAVSASISGAIRQASTASAAVDALIVAAEGYTVSAGISAAIRADHATTSEISSAVQISATQSASVGAAISTPRDCSSSLSAVVSQALAATSSIDSAIQAAASVSAGVSAYIEAAASLTTDDILRLAEIWTRLGLNAAAPTVNSDAAMTAGGMALAFTVAGSDVICQRTDATHPDPIDPATMILEIWQRLGLDPYNAMTTGDARIEVAGIQMDVSGTDTVTVQRLWGD
jgi:hypothetical protein